MAQCTAPIKGHRSAAAAAACPVCGRLSRRNYFPTYNYYPTYSNSGTYSGSSNNTSGGSGKSRYKAKWSPKSSTVLYTSAQIKTLAPVRESVLKQKNTPEKYDLFLCHAWDDRKGVAKELYDKLISLGTSVWFSEKDLPLGTTMLREIDKGLAKSCVGIVLVTPAFLKRVENEGVADKELSALLAKDRLIPIVHNTTYDVLREVSPLLGSRSGLDTNEDSLDEIATKLSELFIEEE